MATPVPSQNSTSSQASWQTAYWTLIPLAVNTMAQPSGRILGLPAKYRTYLRCSPLICTADSLSIFIHLILYYTAFPFKDAIRLLIHQRFDDDEKDDGKDGERYEEGFQAVEKLTFVRWLFFIFGTLGPGIKLMAMEGVPWTKTWGAMFLVSFLVVEGLVVLSWICIPYDHYELLPGSLDADKLLRLKGKLQTIDMHILYSSVLCYALVLIWVVVDIHDTLGPFAWNPAWKHPHSLSWALFLTLTGLLLMADEFLGLLLFLAIVLIIIWPGPIVHLISNRTPANSSQTYGIMHELAFRLCLTFFLAFATFFLGLELVIGGLIVWTLLLVLVLPGLISYLYLETIADSFPRLSRSIFITWESSIEKLEKEKKREERGVREGVPDLTFQCFAMFLYSTILCVVWYWYRYDPEGTVNRGWTGVFG
ncbi:hypothetical protein DL95DRAFT_476286 [Leptodontidium sp. 2 PMI_412]|nr:hypothetical protein DL95DRAFT_476286 [Leptodontidium sp. 2 PMI_412]